MATPLVERTVLPPEDLGRLGGVLAALTTRRAPGAALVGPDGERLELPPEVFEILREVVEALAGGLAITIAPHQMILSTSEAADILGVSRPTLVRLLESGEIPFEQPGRHRRVRLADVLAYQERGARHRAAGLDQMVADAEDARPGRDRPRRRYRVRMRYPDPAWVPARSSGPVRDTPR